MFKVILVIWLLFSFWRVVGGAKKAERKGKKLNSIEFLLCVFVAWLFVGVMPVYFAVKLLGLS